MLRLRAILIIFFFVNCFLVSATKYYVSSSTGNDDASMDGKSETAAWKTISRVNGMTFLPGDSILFIKGDVWRETLTVPSSGNEGAYIVFTSYGTGDKPKILGSNVSSTWADQGGNIWKSNSTFTDPYASTPMAEVFFEQSDGAAIWGTHKTNTSDLATEYDWTWLSNYIYVYAASDPGSRYVSVEVPQRNFLISLNDKQYITIDGLQLQFGKYSGVDFQGTYPNLQKNGFIIRNSNLSYFGSISQVNGFGVDVVYTDMVVENCIIHDSGRRNISLNMYGSSDVSNIIIQNNTLYNGNHTTGVDLSQSGAGTIDNVIIRNNLLYDDLNSSTNHSILIFLQRSAGKVQNIYIYNNIFKYPITSAIQPEGVDKVYIYNNVFYGFNANVSPPNDYHIYISAGSTSITIKNNIFYSSQNLDFSAIYTTVSTSNIIADYNIYYRINNTIRMININGSSYYHMNDLALVRSNLGWETHGQFIDPKFISATDYHLQTGSPAIGKGINIKMIITDYDSNYYNDPPSIGVYEGNPPDEPKPPAPGDEHIIILYPNPANGNLTILREGSTLTTQRFRIISMSGKIVFEGFLEEGIIKAQFSLNLNAGIYVVQVLSGNLTTAAQKLIVINL